MLDNHEDAHQYGLNNSYCDREWLSPLQDLCTTAYYVALQGIVTPTCEELQGGVYESNFIETKRQESTHEYNYEYTPAYNYVTIVRTEPYEGRLVSR